MTPAAPLSLHDLLERTLPLEVLGVAPMGAPQLHVFVDDPAGGVTETYVDSYIQN